MQCTCECTYNNYFIIVRAVTRALQNLNISAQLQHPMAEKRLSKRSERRLRLQIAKRLAADISDRPSLTVGGEGWGTSTANTDSEDSEDTQREASGDETDGEYGLLSSSHGGFDLASSESEPASSVTIRNSDLDLGDSDSEQESPVLRSSSDSDPTSDPGTSESEPELFNSPGLPCSDFDTTQSSDSEADMSVSRSQHKPALFEDSRLSANAFDVAFMSVSQRHNLTYASQSDILKLISLVAPVPNHVPSSARTLRNKFVSYGKETIVHHFCGHCIDALLPGQTCTKQACISAMVPVSTLVEVPLDMQLKARFEGTCKAKC